MKSITPAKIAYIFLAAFIFTMMLQLLNLWTNDTPIRFTPTTLLVLPGIALVMFVCLGLLIPRLIRRLKSRGGWWTRFRLLWLENSVFFFLIIFYIDISDLLLESGADFDLLSTLVGAVVGGLLGGAILAWTTPKDEKGETEGESSTLVSSGDSSGS